MSRPVEAWEAVTCTGAPGCACPAHVEERALLAPAPLPCGCRRGSPSKCIGCSSTWREGTAEKCSCPSHPENDDGWRPPSCGVRKPAPVSMLSAASPPSCLAGGVTTRADVAPPQHRDVAVDRACGLTQGLRAPPFGTEERDRWSDDAILDAGRALGATTMARSTAALEARAAAHPRGVVGVVDEDDAKRTEPDGEYPDCGHGRPYTRRGGMCFGACGFCAGADS